MILFICRFKGLSSEKKAHARQVKQNLKELAKKEKEEKKKLKEEAKRRLMRWRKKSAIPKEASIRIEDEGAEMTVLSDLRGSERLDGMQPAASTQGSEEELV